MQHRSAFIPRQRTAGPACSGLPLELFYGPEGRRESATAEQTRTEQAKAVCASCPIRPACLAEDLSRPMDHQYGIRGGLTADERRSLLRRLRRTAARKPVVA